MVVIVWKILVSQALYPWQCSFPVLGLNNVLIGIKYIRYNNREGTLASGACCDSDSPSNATVTGSCPPDLCDTSFTFCISRFTLCDVINHQRMPTVHNNNSFKFGKRIGNGNASVYNMVALKIPYSDENIEFDITADERSNNSNHQLIATYNVTIDWVDPIFNRSPKFRRFTLEDRNVELVVDIVSMCVSGYYTANCSVYCKSDKKHYHCLDNGTKSCYPGWEGDNCMTMTNLCPGNNCQHGSTCTPALLNYTCVCPSGYTGVYCEAVLTTSTMAPITNPSSQILTGSPTVLTVTATSFPTTPGAATQTDTTWTAILVTNTTTPKSTKIPSITPNQTTHKSTKISSTTPNPTTPKSTNIPSTTPNQTIHKSTKISSTTPNQTTHKSTKISSTTPNQTTHNSTKISSTTPNQTTHESTKFTPTTPNLTTHESTKIPSITPNQTTHESTKFTPTTPNQTTHKSTKISSTTPNQTTHESTKFTPTTPNQTTHKSTKISSTTPNPTTHKSTNISSTTPNQTTHKSTNISPTTPNQTTNKSIKISSTTPNPTTHASTNISSTTPNQTTHNSTGIPSTTPNPTTHESTSIASSIPNSSTTKSLPTTTSSSESSANSSSSDDTTAISLGVSGGLLFLLLCSFLACLVYRKNKRQKIGIFPTSTNETKYGYDNELNDVSLSANRYSTHKGIETLDRISPDGDIEEEDKKLFY